MKKFYVIFKLNGNWFKDDFKTNDIEGCEQAIFLFINRLRKIMVIDSITYEIFETEEEAKNYVWENIA